MRVDQEKITLFRSCFSGLRHVYGTYDVRTGRAAQIKRPVTDQVVRRHLTGLEPYGVYLLTGDLTSAVVADFDAEDAEPPKAFACRAERYAVRAYVERSKSKGWHVWIFAEAPGVSAAKARAVAKRVLADIGKPLTEVFPKQDRLGNRSCYGNFINTPLYGSLVARGRTVFVDPRNDFTPYRDQWALLRSIQRVGERTLDRIIQANGLALPVDSTSEPDPSCGRPVTQRTFGLPPCAQRMLAGGVTENQRVACFRLALLLKKSGVPRDIAIAGLRVWAAKNRPENDKRVITDAEITRQTADAYSKPYRGCGCEEPAVAPYCDPSCPLRNTARVKAVVIQANVSPSEFDSLACSHRSQEEPRFQESLQGPQHEPTPGVSLASSKDHQPSRSRSPPEEERVYLRKQSLDSNCLCDHMQRSIKMSHEAPRRPVKKFQVAGNGVVTASVWRNEIEKDGDTFVKYSVSLEKSYCDRETKAWCQSDSYFPEDLPKLRLVIDKAYEYTKLREPDPQVPTRPDFRTQADVECESSVPVETE